MNAVLFVTNVKLLSTNSKLNIVFDWLIDDNFRQRVNTIYDSLVITILDNTKYCYFNLRQVLQLTTTVITIYDRSRYNTAHFNRELKHQRRRWPRKRHLNWVDSRSLKLYSAYSISKNLANVRWPIFVELNSKGLYQSLGKVQESCFFVCSHPRQKVKLCILTMQSCNDGLEKYKNAWCKSKVVFFYTLNQLFFFPVLVAPLLSNKKSDCYENVT